MAKKIIKSESENTTQKDTEKPVQAIEKEKIVKKTSRSRKKDISAQEEPILPTVAIESHEISKEKDDISTREKIDRQISYARKSGYRTASSSRLKQDNIQKPIQQPAEQADQINSLAYRSARERFADIIFLAKGLVLRYIRRYSERIISEGGYYDPVSPAAREILNVTGVTTDTTGDGWLDQHGFPQLISVSTQIQDVKKIISRRIDATRQMGHVEYLTPEIIQQQFQLSYSELLLLCVIAAGQLDDSIARLYQFATGWSGTIFPGWFYANLIAEGPITPIDILHMLDPGSPLTMLSLVETGQNTEWGERTPSLHAPLSVPNRIVSFLVGLDADSRMAHADLYYPHDLPDIMIPASFKEAVDVALAKQNPRLGLYGCQGFGRRSYVREYAANHHLNVLEIDLTTITPDESPSELLTDAGLWFRESRLRKAIMLIRCDGNISSEAQSILEQISEQFKSMMSKHTGAICFTAFSITSLTRKLFGPHTEIFCPEPLRGEQHNYWRRALSSRLSGDRLEETVQYISSSYCLTPGEVESTILACQARIGSNEVDGESLAETLRTTRGRALEGLADLKPTPLGLKDIVLTPQTRATIDEILNFAEYSDLVRHEWGFSRMSSAGGLSVLFSGPPGTGKTLTAGVIAHELKRALYVVDISRIIDKYIGETEKRLAKIFDHAQTSQAILLFDEADSLFAKRTNVKSSNDRYANIEVNYLLQRLESYHGISILTTNLADSLDEALQRRIQFKIVFPMPTSKERANLWDFLLPKQARGEEEIDFESLGEGFEMSGGYIKNAVFRACIQAASQNRCVNTDMLWEAALHEFREMGHVIRDSDNDYF